MPNPHRTRARRVVGPLPGLATLALLAVVGSVTAPPASAQMHGDRGVHAALDVLHRAAAESDYETYVAAFSDDAIFLGTDATERWTKSEFAAYARPIFAEGRGWSYTPVERWVSVSGDGTVAWFDERLENDNLGDTRGSGVLVRTEAGWKVSQYNLTIPIPNALAREFVARIREEAGG